jgi:HSP20 family protein
MYGSSRQGSRSWLGDVFGFDPTTLLRNPEAYGFDIQRTDEGYRIEVPVAGFRPDEIHVTVEDRQLTIEGRGERRRFTRAIVLPDEIDAEKIDAHVEHGLLTLLLPLHAKMQPRRIEVRVAGQDMKNVGSSSQTGTSQSEGGTTGTVPSVSGESQNGATAQTTTGAPDR